MIDHVRLAVMAWNTVYRYCRYIVNSWLYWQDSMDDWKVADHYLSGPCGYFPDHMKIYASVFHLINNFSLINEENR